ncbi:spore coat protein [uncultured Ruminococcus sp.]|uniref:spore coat protein n=1 Tax=uncultured Ruminococcus sp. TaxID=165186 RepID=UPI00164B8330|nr:spore coat protein [uncultured Ruminococcus sp.]
MDDRNLMQNLLLLEKGCCDLYMHGAVESANSNVQGAFNAAYDDSLSMQSEIFAKMTDKGWYNVAQVEQQKVDQLKQQFATAQ